MTYSNPRLWAVIENWPLGRDQRGPARFSIEKDAKRGERAVRTTTGAPKKLTYALKARIVDGDDGRTYLAMLSGFGLVSIMRGDMKYQEEVVHATDPRYRELLALFEVVED